MQLVRGSARRWCGGWLAHPKVGKLSTKVHQHIVLVEFDIGREDPACLRVERLRGELQLECMKD